MCGVTGDYVLGMQIVLANGTASPVGVRLKDVAEPDRRWQRSASPRGPTLRLLPHRMHLRYRGGQLRLGAGGGGLPFRPAMLEFMDSVAISAVEDTLRMDLDRGAANAGGWF